jgi:hypothetical protein
MAIVFDSERLIVVVGLNNHVCQWALAGGISSRLVGYLALIFFSCFPYLFFFVLVLLLASLLLRCWFSFFAHLFLRPTLSVVFAMRGQRLFVC